MIACYGLLVFMLCQEPQAAPPAAVRCPPLVTYGAEAQKAAARQLRGLPAGSPVRVLVKDYGDLRARCRALESAN